MTEIHHFFVKQKTIQNDHFILDKNESHHLYRVARVNLGDAVILLNGEGAAYRAVVRDIDDNHLISGTIHESIKAYHEPGVKYHLGIGILKGDKIDLVVEKCTELGVASIAPLMMKHNVKQQVNLERLEKIARSAVKQCGRGYLPEIHPLMEFYTWVNLMRKGNGIVTQIGQNNVSIWQYLTDLPENLDDIWITIGPEGGFHTTEIDLINKHKIPFVSMGQRRLKSETAAIAAMSVLDTFFNRRSAHD